MDDPGGAPACPNCGTPAGTPFCATCGQAQRSLHVPFRRVVAETLEETLSLDSKLSRTLPALFLHPGAATVHFLEGRRASFTSPLKLYLLTSFCFFLALSVGPDFKLRLGGSQINLGPAEAPGAQTSPVTIDDEELASLRARGDLGVTFADRLEELSRLPPKQAQRRLNAALVDNSAKAMFVLVPLMAVVLLVLHRRRGLFYTEHLVTTMHAQTVTFAVLLPGVATGSGTMVVVGLVVASVHLGLALRRVYGTSAWGTAWRWLVLCFSYGFALALTLVGASLAALFTG